MSIPYASTSDFALFFDVNALGELGSDTGGDSPTSSIVSNALSAASYDVQSFVLTGGTYTSAELDDLQTGGDLTLKRLVCVKAAEILVGRRLGAVPDFLKTQVEQANLTLMDLRNGRKVFGSLADAHADSMNPSASFVSVQARAGLRMASDSEFFPRRITDTV